MVAAAKAIGRLSRTESVARKLKEMAASASAEKLPETVTVSRYVLSWRLSNALDGLFCLEALEEALARGTPEIFNTDQGVQYTAQAFTGRLEAAGVAVSMDGRGRWMDNVFVERLWRTVKYEHLYLHDYATPRALQAGLGDYFPLYNEERIHAALDYRTPLAVYREATGTRGDVSSK